MEIRVLTEEELHLLRQTPVKDREPLSEITITLGAFENGELIGTLMLAWLPHLESAWVREDHRGGQALARLHDRALQVAKAINLPKVFALVEGKMEEYAERLGYRKTNLSLYEKEI